ncbi:zinc finger protein 154-like isoform X1 [Uloborus diversus]|uniref:zinc finger protein 154-like isoform X1 n=1 Tax=Uloborus diversus TaxID=327109 RepID=UPI0024098286|nr:zinc finger protein 154-like isoform X1 [Uloborus diversus]
MFEIYSEVRAILSSHVIGAIEGCVLEAVERCVPAGARVERLAQGGYQLSGTLDGILAARGRLEELLRRKESPSERDSTTLSDETASYDRGAPTTTSCPSDAERDPTASSNGYVSTTTTESSSVRRTLRQPLSRKLRFILKGARSGGLRGAPKRRAPAANDPDRLSENLRHMKLATEESDPDSEGKADSAPYKHSCKLCSFKTKRSSHFIKHMAIHEKVSTLHRCGQCSFTSVRLSHLRRHEMIHSATVHQCSQCRYRTDDLKFLLRHVRLKHRGDEAPSHVLSCPHCSYQTTKQHYYDRHRRMHCSRRSTPLHQCEQCRYKTHRKEHFVRHVNDVHGNRRPHLCHLCGKAFKRGDALRQHGATHDAAGCHRCGACGKAFRSRSHLSEHRAVHSEVRQFLCEVCGAGFKTRSVHRKHVLSIHRNPRAYTCDACPRKFNTLYALKRHRKVHAGGKVPRPENGAPPDPEAAAPEPPVPVTSEAEQPAPVTSQPVVATLVQAQEPPTLLFLTNNLPQFQ